MHLVNLVLQLAIIEYLDETRGENPLLPRDDPFKRAEVRLAKPTNKKESSCRVVISQARACACLCCFASGTPAVAHHCVRHSAGAELARAQEAWAGAQGGVGPVGHQQGFPRSVMVKCVACVCVRVLKGRRRVLLSHTLTLTLTHTHSLTLVDTLTHTRTRTLSVFLIG